MSSETGASSPTGATELQEVERLLLDVIRDSEGRVWLDDCARGAGLTRAVAKAAARLLSGRGLIKVTGRLVEFTGDREGQSSTAASSSAPPAGSPIGPESDSSGSGC